jgi:hypothetical protein
MFFHSCFCLNVTEHILSEYLSELVKYYGKYIQFSDTPIADKYNYQNVFSDIQTKT